MNHKQNMKNTVVLAVLFLLFFSVVNLITSRVNEQEFMIISQNKYQETLAEQITITTTATPEAIIQEPPSDALNSQSNMLYSQSDLELLAAIVFVEANMESDWGQQLVVITVLNRLYTKTWGGSIEAVIYYPTQFCGIKNPNFGYYSERNFNNVLEAAINYHKGSYEAEIYDILFFHNHNYVDTISYSERFKLETVLIEENHTFLKKRR